MMDNLRATHVLIDATETNRADEILGVVVRLLLTG